MQVTHQRALAREPGRDGIGRCYEIRVRPQALAGGPAAGHRHAAQHRIPSAPYPLDYHARLGVGPGVERHGADRPKPTVDQLEMERLTREVPLHVMHAVHRDSAHADQHE